MKKTVILNAAKLDFDHKLDFSPLTKLTSVAKYDVSSSDEIIARVKDQNVIITKELPVGRNLISQFPASVKLICEAGTGYNNIDIAAAGEKNIAVCNVPGYSTEAVAQLAIAFILDLSSALARQQVMIKRQNFNNFTQFLQVPHGELQNKTLGVIGAGAIGQQVMKIALALGMNILVYSRTPKTWPQPDIHAAGLEELLQKSDFVTIHCPLTAGTKHLINKDRLKLMKSSAFIINTSRGAIIKETDLIEALQNKQLAGAALDVQDPEPPEPDNPLFAMDNVILTPHIGWKCLESRQRLIQLLAANIEAFMQGKPVNIVNQ
ncbi:MAG TPA: NAD(P)-dependent oxidoreductase [Methylomusa anaerophila]|uniref:Putative 2-hydroxyacid dehydrogenase n=1 Tax=Methylomusa anaerophila TaxID=1930071 RepID=A0A348AFR2_9FIRM|nr:NAD(P)-dependent oxidoreductase [Methylomusa anaerophila]BBB89910.1 putative 2-hydroxyacid dehydrogenase [Methylomusa anaerophila]HML90570.1 NAD(P)-dependent oxidoreductase [Methylomusa anaerophila]